MTNKDCRSYKEAFESFLLTEMKEKHSKRSFFSCEILQLPAELKGSF